MLMNSGVCLTGKEMLDSIKGQDIPALMLPLHQNPITSIIHPTFHKLISIIIKASQWG
jgi:hypothetical protein